VLHDFHQRHRQLLRIAQHRMARLAEDAAEVILALTVDREAEWIDTTAPGLVDRLTGILHAVQPLVAVHIVRLAVRDDKEQAMRRRLPLQ
jgi:hypothetical protein